MTQPKAPLLLEATKVLVGAKLELKDGTVVEVTDNPGDGIWLLCRPVARAEGPGEADDAERPVLADEVAGFAD